MTNEIGKIVTEQNQKPKSIKDMLNTENANNFIAKFASNFGNLTPELMKLSITQAVASNEKIRNAGTNEILQAFAKSFQCGLLPNTVHKHAFILPYFNKNENEIKLQFQISYLGLMELCRRDGILIKSGVIYTNDEIQWGEDGFETVFKLKRATGEKGDPVSYYAKAKSNDELFVQVMDLAEIREIQLDADKFAKNKETSIWGKHFGQMALKTVIKRLIKHLQLSPDIKIQNHIEVDNDEVYANAEPAEPILLLATDEDLAEIKNLIENKKIKDFEGNVLETEQSLCEYVGVEKLTELTELKSKGIIKNVKK